MQQIDPRSRQPLYSVSATRHFEHTAQAGLPPHTLMQRAGLAVAQLAMALAPHARSIWIACGPGNNGGDGLEAAMHLLRWGKMPLVTWLGSAEKSPVDAVASYHRAVAAGVLFAQDPPDDFELCVDALLGIGSHIRAPEGRMAQWIHHINAGTGIVLAIDLPTGLHADTGVLCQPSVQASHTLNLLTLKPGLFTASGRDATATIWLHDLACAQAPWPAQTVPAPTAWLGGSPVPRVRRHASHKGSYGDVAVIGGAHGMTGAALLAASAALQAGAGRVYVGLLDGTAMSVDAQQPELMFRAIDALDYSTMTVVCGCGGAGAIGGHLEKILHTNAPVVIDADAINIIAIDQNLQHLLSARASRGVRTVLTPHPLEAARLLGTTSADVQQDRLGAAEKLVQLFGCTVALKGSGTVIAAPGQTPVINPTGNARLATAGTGDVLAGMIGAALAGGAPTFDAACDAVYRHGLAADAWSDHQPLTASAIGQYMHG